VRTPGVARRRRRLLLGLLAALVCLAGYGPPAGRVAGQGDERVALGERLFSANLTVGEGLGPLYNDTSCAGCHSVPTTGGMGPEGLGVAIRVGRNVDGRFDPLLADGGPVARSRSVSELGQACDLLPGIPHGATISSVRNAPPLYGLGLIDGIPDAAILAGAAVGREHGVNGRPQLVEPADGGHRVGRYGWKADTASLEQFVADALRNEHGVTSPLAPQDALPHEPFACAGAGEGLEDDGTRVRALTAYVATLTLPAGIAPGGAPPGDASLVAQGATLFRGAGCIACHTPSLPGPGGDLPLYSDLLLHDMGPALDDGVVQGAAGGRDWRTTPLWGLRLRPRFLHDGRARTVRAAIQAHGGEAAAAAARFRDMTDAERDALLAFLNSL
jgi:CxxC motif-containing protein (DUF1111 family)